MNVRLLVHEDCLYGVGVIGAFEVVTLVPIGSPSLILCWTRSVGGVSGMSSEDLLEFLAIEHRVVDIRNPRVWVEGWDRWYGVPRAIFDEEFVPWMEAAMPLAQAERASRGVCRWVELKVG